MGRSESAVRGCPGMKGGLCLLVLLLASTAALPVEDGVGEALPMGMGLDAFIQESGLATLAAGGNGPFTFAGTLQHVANRFCTEFVHKDSQAPVFCEELVWLQHKWIDADTSGDKEGFTKAMGQLQGHWCPDAAATASARCLVLQLLSKAVPTTLKWSLEKKGYYQMTKDVSRHFCTKE